MTDLLGTYTNKRTLARTRTNTNINYASARRLDEMLALTSRCAAISTAIACQAIDLRGVESLGPRLRAAHARVRTVVPKMTVGSEPPNLDKLIGALGHGILSQDSQQSRL